MSELPVVKGSKVRATRAFAPHHRDMLATALEDPDSDGLFYARTEDFVMPVLLECSEVDVLENP